MSVQTIAVHLPDGAIREVPSGTTPLEIANSISPRLAAASVVARLIPLGGTAVSRLQAKSRRKPPCMGPRMRQLRGLSTCRHL